MYTKTIFVPKLSYFGQLGPLRTLDSVVCTKKWDLVSQKKKKGRKKRDIVGQNMQVPLNYNIQLSNCFLFQNLIRLSG